jgi:hypothetical protein
MKQKFLFNSHAHPVHIHMPCSCLQDQARLNHSLLTLINSRNETTAFSQILYSPPQRPDRRRSAGTHTRRSPSEAFRLSKLDRVDVLWKARGSSPPLSARLPKHAHQVSSKPESRRGRVAVHIARAYPRVRRKLLANDFVKRICKHSQF